MNFAAKVISGKAIGRELGFPTLNLEIVKDLDLEAGVYACMVNFGDKDWKAVLFLGERKTFEDNSPTLEIHVLDEEITTPPSEVKVEIKEKIRSVEKFRSKEKLIEAISKDCEKAKEILRSK
jgi:riboflavin kinase/FMN adenylyltransferase